MITRAVRRQLHRVLTSDPRGVAGVALVALVAATGLLIGGR